MWETFRMEWCPFGFKNQTPRRESTRFSSGLDDRDGCFIGTLTQQLMRKNRGDSSGRINRPRPVGMSLAKAALVLMACYFLFEPHAQGQAKEVRRLLVFSELGL